MINEDVRRGNGRVLIKELQKRIIFIFDSLIFVAVLKHGFTFVYDYKVYMAIQKSTYSKHLIYLTKCFDIFIVINYYC